MTDYTKSSHSVFYHRYHIVWITKYRYKVLTGDLRLRVRELIAQTADEMNARSAIRLFADAAVQERAWPVSGDSGRWQRGGIRRSRHMVQIPIETGQAFRFEAGHHSELKPATIPIIIRPLLHR